jgi:hypothetical protein
LPVANGGTGLTSGTTGQFLKFTGGTTLASSADNAGKILQVVTDNQTSSYTTSSSSYGSVGLDVNITPAATSSKILLLFSSTVDNSASGRQGDLTIWREISSSNVALNSNGFMQLFNSAGRNVGSGAFSHVDSPNTTSQILYRVAARSNTGNEINIGANTGGTVTLTALEISA